MVYLDNTQIILSEYLNETENILNALLDTTPYCGQAKIITNLDLGFPHDVIRIAGGFATGICVHWKSKIPFIPIDICMNVCTVSLYELNSNIELKEECFERMLGKLNDSSYIANFHRGNHFISLLEEIGSHKNYIMIHSSAAEFETLYNGLYPVEGNFFYDNMKIYRKNGKYIRYLSGKSAELFYDIARNAYCYNENRHDFIIASLLDNINLIDNVKHYHHYGMPNENIALIGSHLVRDNQETPLLTREGENVYLIKYNNVLDPSLRLSDKYPYFLTPHGLGKKHSKKFKIIIDENSKYMQLDEIKYKIEYGQSLRAHPGLEIRNIDMREYFKKFSLVYDYNIVNEFMQIVSYNKSGFIKWK